MGSMVGLTHDIIITNVLAYWTAWTDTKPKTFIKKTVDFPESVYWEDNVYHGYIEKERLLMIRSYLDGVHLKTMALNSPDGKVYLYMATPKDWQDSRIIVITKGKLGRDYVRILEAETMAIAERGKILNRNELPQIKYSVVINQVPLAHVQNRYLYSDEIVITDHYANDVIAYNRRLMRYYYQFEFPPFGGCRAGARLSKNAFFGLPDLYDLDDQSILLYWSPVDSMAIIKCEKSYKAGVNLLQQEHVPVATELKRSL